MNYLWNCANGIFSEDMSSVAAYRIYSVRLNLGHSPLYRHFYKCLYIEFDTFPRHDIAKASFALLIWLDGNAVKNFTCLLTITYTFFARQSESKLSLFSLIENVGILPIRFISWFSPALGIAQTCVALHSLARKFIWSQTEKIPATVKDIG